MIRPATPEDLDFLIGLAVARYGPFHVEHAREWVIKVMSLPNYRIIRGERSAICGVVNAYFYNPAQLRGTMLYWVSAPGAGWEAYGVLKALAVWSIVERGAASFHFGEQTGVELAPFAKRLGAVQDRPSWTIANGQDFR